MICKQIRIAVTDFRRKMGSLGKGGGKVSRLLGEPSKCESVAQLVSMSSLMSKMAADRVGKVRYF